MSYALDLTEGQPQVLSLLKDAWGTQLCPDTVDALTAIAGSDASAPA